MVNVITDAGIIPGIKVDTGIGIKEEDIHRHFRPFEQIEASLTKLYTGVGIETN